LNLALWFLETGRLDEAEASANSSSAIAPSNPWGLACRAALRTLQRDDAGATELLARLGPGERYGTPAGLCRYYMLVGDHRAAAHWGALAVEQRDGAFPFAVQFACARGLRASPYWPDLARLMNLA
jgi:hypothetical protein